MTVSEIVLRQIVSDINIGILIGLLSGIAIVVMRKIK